MLKRKVSDINAVPEALRTLYKKVGENEWVLEIEGLDDTAEMQELRRKVGEFRETNITLANQKRDLEAKAEKFKDVDLDKYAEAKEALDAINAIQEKEMIKQGRFDEVVQKRLQAAQAQWDEAKKKSEARIKALEESESKYKGNYGKLKVATEVNRVFPTIAAIRPGAHDDVLERTYKVWKVNDSDELEAKELYGADGKPMSFEDWGKGLVKAAGHLFEAGSGGGAGGGDKKKALPNGNEKTVVAGDNDAFLRNLDGIAAGKVVVVSSDDGGDGLE